MKNTGAIQAALASYGITGLAALHETGTPAVIFTTEDGKAYRADFVTAPDDEACTAMAGAIETATGLHVDWYGPTRAAAAREKEMAEIAEAGAKAAAEAVKHDPPPVKVQSAAEAERARDLSKAR